MTPIDIALVAVGLVLAFAGAALFKYTLAAVGLLSGGAGGFLLANAVAPEPTTVAVAALVGAVVGVFLAFSLITTVATIPGFMLGSYVAAMVVGLDGGSLGVATLGPTLLGGVVGAAICGLLFTKVLPALTALLGAALATRAWTVDAFREAATSLDPSPVLIEPGVPFAAVFVAGTLSQIGLLKLGWTKQFGKPPKALWKRVRGDSSSGPDADGDSDPIAPPSDGDDGLA
ncbi:hypothetical protein SAMN06269185_3037 [Natronoarchaeum philippinense]|uniref:DUF4203 domain-containing protein n=1 Tax=Natronoarchaeum philippinense TaxID=558529 RepID=A0A285P6X1_NATPI|nr:hypothetical protein [Natronoarchaeum philippinense]SNZ17480.1 hypothetical protein SAMN06269185_3037 [Natronoarchaeum philippinense]